MRFVTTFVFMAASWAISVVACPHVPVDYTGIIGENIKQALIFHDGTNAHLVIKTGFEVPVGSKLPKTLAWVIPLPALPVHYQEESAALFPDLKQWFVEEDVSWRMPVPAPIMALSRSVQEPTIKVHDAVQVGSYEVVAIEILSESGGGELNAWLKQNGFKEVGADYQVYYLKKGAAFLAVKMKAPKGDAMSVKPLHIVYPSDEPSLPLKFSAGSGHFQVVLYTVQPLLPLNGAFRQSSDFQSLELTAFDDLEHVRVKNGLKLLLKLIGDQKGYLSCYTGGPYNLLGTQVFSMTRDPFFRTTH